MHLMRKFYLNSLLVASLALVSVTVRAEDCSEQFHQGRAPVIEIIPMKKGIQELCFGLFAVAHSPISKGPVWVAEYLTRDRVTRAKKLSRENNFHPEERVPQRERSELSDFQRSGYDRGHMAPNKDMPDRESQYHSFSLANIIPQDPNNNQVLWAAVEDATRNLARQRNAVYVVTGPVFKGNLKRLNGRVLVPTHVFKAVLDPRTGEAAAWISDNAANAVPRTVTLMELEGVIGIRVFPGVDGSRVLDLPELNPRNRQSVSLEKVGHISSVATHFISRILQR